MKLQPIAIATARLRTEAMAESQEPTRGSRLPASRMAAARGAVYPMRVGSG